MFYILTSQSYSSCGCYYDQEYYDHDPIALIEGPPGLDIKTLYNQFRQQYDRDFDCLEDIVIIPTGYNGRQLVRDEKVREDKILQRVKEIQQHRRDQGYDPDDVTKSFSVWLHKIGVINDFMEEFEVVNVE